jgi:sulfatase maturation enzyme AslB (radical SAM superfamily)
MKHKIKYLQFYIGNVCNLTCPNCASFNNYAFKGQFDWKNTEPFAKQWSEILEPIELAILGGEPFTNINLDEWVHGLLKYFKAPDFRITTNGTFIERDIERILQYTHLGVNIEISSHSYEHYCQQTKFIEQFYPIVSVLEDRRIYKNDSPGFIEVRDASSFFNISIKNVANKTFYMHNSDPIKAHAACLVSDCHYVVHGRLYQCVLTRTAALFAEQFKLDDYSTDLVSKINSISPFDSKETVDTFLNNITSPCAQCALCPEQLEMTQFVLPIKKQKI